MPPQFIGPLMSPETVIEMFFSLIVIVSSFMIFLKTKEIYDLSGHKGIKYFRYAFLFFGFSYVFRLLMRASLFYFGHDLFLFPFMRLFSSLMIYVSSVMFIYLFLTFFWKKLDKTFVSKNYFIYGVPLVLVIVTFFNRIPSLFFYFQILSFISILFFILFDKKNIFNKKHNKIMSWTYLVVFGSWLLIHLLEVLSFFFPVASTIIYLITLCFFVVFIDRVWLHFSVDKGMKEKK